MVIRRGVTPSQTIGPFFHGGMRWENGGTLVSGDVDGGCIVIEGRVFDGENSPVDDALIEIWQATASGHYAHPEDTRDEPPAQEFTGFGRVATDEEVPGVLESLAGLGARRVEDPPPRTGVAGLRRGFERDNRWHEVGSGYGPTPPVDSEIGRGLAGQRQRDARHQPTRQERAGGFVGNRYYVNVYPGFLFLVARVAPPWRCPG